MGLGSLSPGYSSGGDVSLEAEGVRFSFNHEDFADRVGAAAARLGLVERAGDERGALVELALHGRVDGAGSLAERLAEVGQAAPAVVHWLRRLVFRGAWIDQGVTDGSLLVEWDEGRGFRYRGAATGMYTAEDLALPSWAVEPG